MMENQEWTHKRRFLIGSYTLKRVLANQQSLQVCVNIRCSQEDLAEAIDDRDR